jgi:hypothetical protein
MLTLTYHPGVPGPVVNPFTAPIKVPPKPIRFTTGAARTTWHTGTAQTTWHTGQGRTT